MHNLLRGSAILALLLCLSSWAAEDSADGLESSIKSVTEAYAIVEENAANPVSAEQAFFQGAIPGMLRRLDPHSVFFDPGQFEQLKKLQTSTDQGFGSVVSVLPGRVIVLQTFPGTPSARSGMAPGDEIVAVNGYQLSRLDMDQLIGLLSQSQAAAGATDCPAGRQRALPDLRPDARGDAGAQRGTRVYAGARHRLSARGQLR